MKIFHLIAFTLALVSGCVIAPIPLVETECHYLWTGVGPTGKEMTIESVEKTWYMPIVVSPEGPAKDRSLESQYTYYAEDGTSDYKKDHVPAQKAIRLPWFNQKVDGNHEWHDCVRIEGTPYWCMRRVLDFDEAHRNSKESQVWQIEYAVFDLKSLKSKTTLAVICAERLMFRYDDKARSIEHLTPSGWKRHRLLEGTDEEINQPDWAAEILRKTAK